MRVGKRASKRQRQVQNQESKQARAISGTAAEPARKRLGRPPKKAALPVSSHKHDITVSIHCCVIQTDPQQSLLVKAGHGISAPDLNALCRAELV